MSWLDRFRKGSFRGAKFYIEAHQLSSGRRVQDHQFPFIQRNYAEDMGKKTDQFEIDAFLVGDDYDLDRNKLLQALKLPGGGELIHPYLGKLIVNVLNFDLSENKQGRNFCKFKMTFIESGGREYPRESKDERSYIDDLATSANDQGNRSFIDNFSDAAELARSSSRSLQAIRDTINKKLSFLNTIKQAQGAITQALSELELTITSLGATANRIRLLPGSLLDGIVGAVDSLGESFSTAQGRVTALLTFSENDETTIPTFRGSSAEQDAVNQIALSTVFRTRPLAGALVSANEIEYRSEAEALAIRERFLKVIDSIMNQSVFIQGELVASTPLEMLEILADLRSAVVLRFPAFNSATASAVEREFGQEENAIAALFEMTGNTETLDFFLTDNELFDGFVPAQRNVKAERLNV